MAQCPDDFLAGEQTPGCRCQPVGTALTSKEGDVDIKRIVVGVDGSPPATAAARWAAREAAIRNVELTVVHVVHAALRGWPQTAWPAIPVPAEFGESQVAQGEKVLEDALGVIAKTTGPDQPRRIATRLCVGAVVPTLREFNEGTGQMIVVGRRGRGGIHRALLGSVSRAVLHAARCPVVVVHQHVTPARLSGAPVVVGIDRSPASERAAAIAFDEASRRGTHVVAVHAIDGPDTSRAEELLTQSLAASQQRHPDVGVRRVVARAHPADALLDESERAELVVVGSRGHSGLTGKLLGSVSTTVVQACRIPVIVVRRHISRDTYAAGETRAMGREPRLVRHWRHPTTR
jgi:nucleotide-binding universal stress UspA family protein